MKTLSDPNIPSAEQLAETRRAHWHQDGNALLTAEAVLPWIERSGLVLFTSRGHQFPAPAPTLVEATLGKANPSPSVADREAARSLVQRLVAEGTVLPLNLLGAPGTTADEPDFVVSATMFPFLFTLRGDKAWKQLPSAGGPFKVSPLAVNTYTLLSEGGPRSAYDLVSELGKGLTEAAVLRALSELWQHLRVFPVGQPDGPVLWELASARFTKSIKSGANAGQPSALSAFITLYLGQAVLATEEDVEVFLSPLAPRSRVRDVVHALSAGREVDTVVVEGKHSLHVRGDLPMFAPVEGEASAATEPEMPQIEGEGRIKKFAGAARKPAAGAGRSFSSERERRPFAGKRDGARPGPRPAIRKPAFDRPWDEERKVRDLHAEAPAAGAPAKPEFEDIDLDAASDAAKQPSRPTFRSERPTDRPGSRPSDRPKKPFGAGRPGFGPRAAGKPSFGDRAGRKPAFGDRPNSGSASRPPFRRDRDGASGQGGDRPAYSRPREGAGAGFAGRERPPFRRDGDESRPKRPFVKRGFDTGSGPGSAERSGERPSPGRKFGPPAGDRPFRPRREDGAGSRPPRDFGGAKPFGGERQKRTYGPPTGDTRPTRSPRPERGPAPERSSRPERARGLNVDLKPRPSASGQVLEGPSAGIPVGLPPALPIGQLASVPSPRNPAADSRREVPLKSSKVETSPGASARPRVRSSPKRTKPDVGERGRNARSEPCGRTS